jgi:hypothetical protein
MLISPEVPVYAAWVDPRGLVNIEGLALALLFSDSTFSTFVPDNKGFGATPSEKYAERAARK